MTEDWAAVSSAIKARMVEQSMSQRKLIDRSRVSKAIVSEIQNNKVERNRGGRTLEALSLALGWHQNHLDAVLKGHPIPQVGDPVVHSETDVPGHLAAITHELRKMNDHLERIGPKNDELHEIATETRAAVQRIADSIADNTDR